MNITAIVPTSILLNSENEKSKEIIDLALNAIKFNIKPVSFVSGTETEKVSVYIKQSIMGTFKLHKPDDLPLSTFVSQLAYAYFLHTKNTDKIAPTDWGSMRAEQIRLINQCESEVIDKKIVLQEAGTGVGKTRAALAMAARHFNREKTISVITVPAVALIAQVLKDYDAMDLEDFGGIDKKPYLAPLIARSSFVDPEKLIDFINNSETLQDVDKAKSWMASGAGYVDGSSSKILHDKVPGICWLKEDLAQAAPNFPANDVLMSEISSDDKCPATIDYQKMRINAQEASIIVCTHAMLAIDTIQKSASIAELENSAAKMQGFIDANEHDKTKLATVNVFKENLKKVRARINEKIELGLDDDQVGKGVLPDYKFLIVDEAHQFENSIANLKTSDAIMRFLTNDLSKNDKKLRACKSITAANSIESSMRNIEATCIKFGSLNPSINQACVSYHPNHAQFSSKLYDLVKDDFDVIIKAASQVIKKCPELKSSLVKLLTVAKNISGKSDRVIVKFSPRRKYPSFHTGPTSVSGILERIWQRIDSAVILSATLALPNQFGGYNTSFIKQSLAIPSERMKTQAPVVQPWLYDALLFEKGKNRPDLMPPNFRDAEKDNALELETWSKAIASETYSVSLSAKGGILALTSSYDRADAIAKHLIEMSIDEQRIVLQKRNASVKIAINEFKAKYLSGINPIWIGTGAAWTGIDIKDDRFNDENAKFDFMLTDLVICNIPYGTNHSSTHAARTEWNRFAERDRAALEFKQGIGRLMRRAGLKDRKIYILDPRIYDVGNKAIYYIPFRTILKNYKRG